MTVSFGTFCDPPSVCGALGSEARGATAGFDGPADVLEAVAGEADAVTAAWVAAADEEDVVAAVAGTAAPTAAMQKAAARAASVGLRTGSGPICEKRVW
ncbi:hypothetical protein [Curtobacterium sp. MCBD17_019]|uniref:hypothetical protein n=1 Tax=Curtobacterium sp. MCBD17_019 TaxID=2175669 RepID=UPI0015E8B64A|nr:hypothetical protein [Curtobacterium sp. MCBD17_019]